MELTEKEKPDIRSDTDVLIRMQAVGICGSDVHYYVSGKIGSQRVRYPFSVGHEGAGIVEKTGNAVSDLHYGDRVAIEPAMPCGECDQCKEGRPHTCRNLRFLGCPGQADGCLSEYIVMPQKSCLPIPDHLSFEQAAISEPLAIGLYAVQTVGETKGKNAAVLGSGPIGLSVLAGLKSAGARYVCVTDKIDARLSIALASGADATCNVLRDDVAGCVKQHVPQMLDFVFECCGQQEALDQSIRLLKPGGTLSIIGIPEFSHFSFPVDELRHKEITIRNVRRQNGCDKKAIEAIAGGNVKVEHWITHRFAPEACGQAFELVAGYRDGVMKAMIHF